MMHIVSPYTPEYTEHLKREHKAYGETWERINHSLERCEKALGVGSGLIRLEERAEFVARQLEAHEWRQRKKALEHQVFLQAQKLILESLLSEHITHSEKNARLRGLLTLIERDLDLRPNGDADFQQPAPNSDDIPF